jgi:hypothetical protein
MQARFEASLQGLRSEIHRVVERGFLLLGVAGELGNASPIAKEGGSELCSMLGDS